MLAIKLDVNEFQMVYPQSFGKLRGNVLSRSGWILLLVKIRLALLNVITKNIVGPCWYYGRYYIKEIT